MNEEELKEIWKREKVQSVPIVNFEQVQKNVFVWQGKLRRKIKLDILANVLGYVFLIPLFIVYPKLLYFLPLLLLIWIWYLWETLRIYQQETSFKQFNNTKEYLANKKKFLENYLSRTRYFSYILTPLIALTGFYLAGNFEIVQQASWTKAAVILSVHILILVIFEILVLISVETYIRNVYSPSVNELKSLIQQLSLEE